MGQKTSKPSDTVASRPRGDINLPHRPSLTSATTFNYKPQHFNLETVKYPHAPLERRILPVDRHVTHLPPVIPRTFEQPIGSWQIYNQHYKQMKFNGHDIDYYDTRIRENAEASRREREQDEKIRAIQHKRARAETELLTGKESAKPISTIQSIIKLGARYANFKNIDASVFASKPERPILTPEMLMLIEKASVPSPTTEVLAQIDGVDIARKDIRTLTGLNWLNDEIINAYMYLIVERSREPKRKRVYAFNTFFYPKVRESGYNSVKRWTRKVDIFSFDHLLVPVHLGNHWCLAFIDLNNRRIEYYDSLGGGSNGCCDTLLDYLRNESNDKKKQELDDENWRLVNAFSEIGIPKQENCSDCGVFACTYAEYLTRHAKLTFTQEHMEYFRQKMIYELITKKILE